MKTLRAEEILPLLMRLMVGGIFVYSGWEKLTVPIQNFMAVIQNYQFLKSPFVEWVAFILPWFELVFGTFLLLGFMMRISAGVLAVFLLSFIALLGRSLLLKLPISECGCFGSGLSLVPWQAMILDGGLFLLALMLIFKDLRFFSLDDRLHR